MPRYMIHHSNSESDGDDQNITELYTRNTIHCQHVQKQKHYKNNDCCYQTTTTTTTAAGAAAEAAAAATTTATTATATATAAAAVNHCSLDKCENCADLKLVETHANHMKKNLVHKSHQQHPREIQAQSKKFPVTVGTPRYYKYSPTPRKTNVISSPLTTHPDPIIHLPKKKENKTCCNIEDNVVEDKFSDIDVYMDKLKVNDNDNLSKYVNSNVSYSDLHHHRHSESLLSPKQKHEKVYNEKQKTLKLSDSEIFDLNCKGNAKIPSRQFLDDHNALELHDSKCYIVSLIDRALSKELGTVSESTLSKNFENMSPKKATDTFKRHFAINHPQKTYQNDDQIQYMKHLRQMRWCHLRQIQKEAKRLADLEKFLDNFADDDY